MAYGIVRNNITLFNSKPPFMNLTNYLFYGYKTVILLVVSVLLPMAITAQNTVGTLLNTPDSYHGYTLISNFGGHDAYLINNCGEVVHEWNCEYKLATTCLVTPEGNLLRSSRLRDSVHIKESGGYRYLDLYSWDGDLIWQGDFDNPTLVPHHDFKLMPNGNVLMTFWEVISLEESIAAGRVDSFATISTVIREIEIKENNEYEVAWEWRMWDHVIQEADPSKPNYSKIKAHPEKMDMNCKIPNSANLPINPGQNLFHVNSVAYNEDLDQIMFSSRQKSEIYIIDHSTTTKQAKGSKGGKYKKGGDFLYRYGNPYVAQQGTIDDRVLFTQHDAQWIPEGQPHAGNIILFNNGYLRPIPVPEWYSEILIIEPPVNKKGHYPLSNNNYYPESEILFQYDGGEDNFFSRAMSGVQPLPNGNYLISSARKSRVLEINKNKELVSDYIIPLKVDKMIAHSDSLNYWGMFKTQRYAPEFSGFSKKNLTPNGTLGKTVTTEQSCILHEDNLIAIKPNDH